jgi:hypothetical protein
MVKTAKTKDKESKDSKLMLDTKVLPLSKSDQAEVEKTFSEAKDFRSL